MRGGAPRCVVGLRARRTRERAVGARREEMEGMPGEACAVLTDRRGQRKSERNIASCRYGHGFRRTATVSDSPTVRGTRMGPG